MKCYRKQLFPPNELFFTFSLCSGEDDEDTMQLCESLYKDVDKKHGEEFTKTMDEFFTVLTICNTVVVSSQAELISETLETSADLTFTEDEARIPNGNGVSHKRISLQNTKTNNSLDVEDVPRSHTISGPPEVVIEPASPQTPQDAVRLSSTGSLDFLGGSEQRRVRMFSTKISDRLSRSIESINSWLNYGLVPSYEYESPDEGALVKAACQYNYKLANRTPEQIFFTTPDGEIKVYDILQVLAFDSTRKRMSIIVRDDVGQIKIYCKGADASIMSRLEDGQGKTAHRDVIGLERLFFK